MAGVHNEWEVAAFETRRNFQDNMIEVPRREVEELTNLTSVSGLWMVRAGHVPCFAVRPLDGTIQMECICKKEA